LSALGAYPALLVQSSRSEELIEAYYLRLAETSGQIDMRLCLHVPLRHGHLQKLVDYATDPRLAFLGLPISDEMLEQAAARLPEDALDTPNLFAAAYAIDRGDWDEYETILSQMRQRLENAESEGDSAGIDGGRFQLRSAEAIGLMERGQLAEAAAAFEALRSPFWPHRWWLGQIYLELGQPSCPSVERIGRWPTCISARPTRSSAIQSRRGTPMPRSWTCGAMRTQSFSLWSRRREPPSSASARWISS
jgi:hypothetical protein